MEEYFIKLKDYLKMDTEIPYDEFAVYYQSYLDFLNKKYSDLNKDELIKGRFICSVLQANSHERSRRKDKYAKKYKKIAEKTQFWAGSMKFRLQKEEGMTDLEIEQANEKLHELS
ncbi:MAG: hypothetical protein ACOX4L_06985 [Bacillota bacterium]